MNLTLHLTTACNMRCAYCYAPPHGGPVMSMDTARQALDLSARINQGAVGGIVFFGGEPLLHPQLIRDIVAEAQERQARGQGRYHFKLTTNGLALTEDFLEFAVRERVHVAMSFDGVAAAHDQHRRLPGGGPSFEVLLPRLQRLLEVQPYATVFLVVTPGTAAFLAESATFLLELGVRYLVVSLDHPAPWTQDHFQVLQDQYERIAELYLDLSRAGRKFYFSPFDVKIASHVQGEDWQSCRCSLAEHQVSVDTQGWIYPCVQFTRGGPDWRMGHVSTGFDLEALSRVRAIPTGRQPECQSCAMAHRCQNTCACLSWQSTGDPSGISPAACAHERILLPLADRIAETLYAEDNRVFKLKHYEPGGPLRSLLEDLRT